MRVETKNITFIFLNNKNSPNKDKKEKIGSNPFIPSAKL